MSIVIQHRESGRRALITTLFLDNHGRPNFAYCRSFGQTLKSVIAGRMKIVKECKSLPAAMFGKRKGPFLKLAPAPGWDIVDFFE
jgi:hypothetical protein